MQSNHETAALDYLKEALAQDAPQSLALETSYSGRPLEREGDMSVFSFQASIGGQPEDRYWVVAGQTSANHYPHWGLTPEQVYELHLGTRFMLVMEVSSVPIGELPGDFPQQIEDFIGSVAPGEPVSDIEPAAAFLVADEVYAICRASVAGETVYVLGMKAPPGIYRDTHLLPHVVFRLHIGRHIRREAEGDTES